MTQRLVWNFEFSGKHTFSLPQNEYPKDHLKWEIRSFWPEQQIITLYNIDDSLLILANYRSKQKEDEYYLFPESDYNIKRRKHNLLYKPAVQHMGEAIGYGTKISLDSVNDLGLDLEKSKTLVVNKESFTYTFATTPSVQLELARLHIKGDIFFSVCVEGKSLDLVKSISKHLLQERVSCDYVGFLKKIIKS